MASNIELLVFDGASVPGGLPAQAAVVRLSSGLGAIPVSEALLSALPATSADGDAVRPGWTLKPSVCHLAQQLSVDRWVLYVTAETFGRRLTEEAAGWHHGELAYGPSGTCGETSELELGYQLTQISDSAVNVGLRLMGVRAGNDLDEFAAAGLAAHRFTSEWLTE